MGSGTNILITGASGFIGSFITEEAIKRGYNVYVAVRRLTNTSALRKMNINIIEFDFHNEELVRQKLAALPRFKFIIHNAGLTKAINSSDYYEVNYGNTHRLIEGLRSVKGLPVKFIYISSIAAQGPGKVNPSEKDGAFASPLPLTEYGRSKLAAEQLIISSPDLSYIILRPTAVYGPGDHDFLKAVKFLKWGIDFKVGKQPQKLTFLYVKDLARVVFESMEAPCTNRSWFVSDGCQYTHLDFGKAVSKFLNRKILQVPVPLKLAMIIGSVNEVISGFAGKPPLINREKLAELSATNWNYSNEPIEKDIGFKAEFNLNSGVAETISWYKKEGWI